jgi:predicted nucleic acid-binding protein
MRIIISDSSCLIDLHKAGLHLDVLTLPFTFVVPQPLYDRELLSIPPREREMMVARGMQVQTLTGDQTQRAQDYASRFLPLAVYDCFALVLAETNENALLLTGDGNLRKVAEGHDVETHGVLWAVDQMEAHTDIPIRVLLEALQLYERDPMVWLPEAELRRRIRGLERRLRR